MKLVLPRTSFVAAIGAPIVLAAFSVLPSFTLAQQPEPPAPAPEIPAPPAAPQTAAPQNPQVPAVPSETAAIKVSTGLVHLVATVTDNKHNFVTDLDRQDFKVLENGAAQEIQFFGRQTDLPLRIAVLLDTSNSIRPRLEFEKDAAIDFLTSVVRRNKDLAFLMTFDNEPQVIQDYTDNLSLLTTAIREQRAGGGTALNDAICIASDKLTHLPQTKSSAADVRRVIVVISDGEDNLSDHALSDATDASIRSEAAVFTISTNTDWLAIDNPGKPKKYLTGRGDKVLLQFADQTGGRAFFPYSTNDLAASFTEIGTELRSQYYIAYSPTVAPNGQYRQIAVQTGRKGLVVRTRKGYYALAPAPVTAPTAKP